MSIALESWPRMANLNPYLAEQNKNIIYKINETKNGWDIEVLMPRRLPVSDRAAILDWVHRYRRQIRDLHPFWSVAFHPSAHRYALEIKKTKGDQELIEIGENLKSACGEIMEYAS